MEAFPADVTSPPPIASRSGSNHRAGDGKSVPAEGASGSDRSFLSFPPSPPISGRRSRHQEARPLAWPSGASPQPSRAGSPLSQLPPAAPPPSCLPTGAMAMKQTPLTCSGHTRPVVDLAFSGITPYGYFLISACKDGKPMFRQGDTGDWIGTFLGHKGAVWGATLNSDATKAATAAADFTAKLWDGISGDELLTLAHKHIVKSVDFTQDSNYLLTGGQDKLLRIYDLNKPEAEPEMVSGHTSGIKKALWSSDDTQILSADDKTVRLWDRNTLTEVKAINVAMSVSSMEYVREGEIIVITYGRTIAFHSAETLEQIKSFEAPATINSASLHPEKECLVAGGEDFKLYKYDYNTGEELESYKGHFGPIHCVRFSPDGELYASGSEDGTLRLWQTTVGKTYGLWKCVIPEEEGVELTKAKVNLPGTTEEELEDLGSENADSIYSTPPEVKA
ncbi:serine-threonine kinase receptor-associated protein [Erythrolamprus reginae]|uniref:serine-threonine kinase receptor-associated protein n=1 Tax=Erythrolamprus reginae TaxID=121349 RepID=UPI00396CDFE2